MYAARFARRHGRAPVRDRGHPEVRRGAPPERARQHVAPRPPLDGPELQSHAHHTVCKSNFRADSSVDLRSGITKKFSGRNALPRGRYRRTAAPEPAAVWKSNFGRPTPSTRRAFRSCVCAMAWRFHAIDATLSPWPRRLDGVEAHEGPRNISQDNLTHWLISTQARGPRAAPDARARVPPARPGRRREADDEPLRHVRPAHAAVPRRRHHHGAGACVEINQCDGCTRQLFTKSFLGDGVAALAPSSGEEPTWPRHRAGVASMSWRATRWFSTNAP